jgi:RNA polymerase sigma-70 factor (ECF subfamily)
VSTGETALLFARGRDGSPDALNAFYERSARKLLAIIRLRLGRSLRAHVESRDILQAVLLKSFPRLSQVENPDHVMGWLARMADHEIRDRIDYLSRQRRDVARKVPIEEHAEQIPAPVRQALSQAIENERAEHLERALESLTEPQRDLIVLRKLHELTFAEIGVRLGKSEDACRVAFARAMAALVLQMKSET